MELKKKKRVREREDRGYTRINGGKKRDKYIKIGSDGSKMSLTSQSHN